MLSEFLNFFRDLFLSIPFNIFDLLLIIVFILYIIEDISFGLIAAGISFASTISSFFVGLAVYPYISLVFINIFHAPKGLSDAISFLIATVLSFILISTLLSILRRKYVDVHFPKMIDKIGGAIFGALSFFFIASFATALLLAFPTSAAIRDAIRSSYSSQFLSNNTQGIDRSVRMVFGGAIEDTINFLTVEPDSNKSVALHFKASSPTIDKSSEEKMLTLLNNSRIAEGKKPLEADSNLTILARKHAKDMLSRGYFSHYTPEGLSPFDRMVAANIAYQFAGENLAFAPDAFIAMNGLMKSPGHRENILNSNFGKVGIGVLDAGIYGKMFVQEFTD